MKSWSHHRFRLIVFSIFYLFVFLILFIFILFFKLLFLIWDTNSIFHKCLEITIIINSWWNIHKEVNELISWNLRWSTWENSVMSLKCFQEFVKYTLFSSLCLNYIWMFLCIELLFESFNWYYAISSFVNLFPSLFN